MASGIRNTSWQRALIALSSTFITVVIVATLYWGRSVFIPLALAIFMTFVLAPLATFLQRRGLGRIPAVLTVVTLTALLLGSLGWIVTRQVSLLVAELPEHTEIIKAKIHSVQNLVHGAGNSRLSDMIAELTEVLQLGSGSNPQAPSPGPLHEPPTVVVKPDSPPWLAQLSWLLGPAAEMLGQAALAIVLVFFMLLQREDLRNRFIRLVGHGQITVTTKAVDDAGRRISRYLLMQVIVNGSYGAVLAIGLFLLGVPHAFLWGFIAAVFRYVPYIGAPIAALLPISLSVATSTGWAQPLSVVGLVVVLELVSNNLMEPWLYGQSMGLSEVAQLTSTALWAFLWGPIGLVLSGPLTVCLLVLGKYVPHLRFLEVLLGHEPPLAPDVTYHQRLMARDQDEAMEIVQAQIKDKPAIQVYDDLLIPALSYARQDRDAGDLTAEDEHFIRRATDEILDSFNDLMLEENKDEVQSKDQETPPLRVLACPAQDELDQLALEMLRQLLNPTQWDIQITDVATLASELVSRVEDFEPAVIIISSLPPGGLAHARYLCKRLRSQFKKAKIIVGRWGLRDHVEENQKQLMAAGANHVEVNLLNARQQLQTWLPVLTHTENQKATPLAMT